MADTGIFCTTDEVKYKAGFRASTVSNTETYINNFVTQAESYINVQCRFNFSDTYSTLNVDVKGILKECASCLAAMSVINYDMSGWRMAEVQTMLNYLWNRAQLCIEELRASGDKLAFIKAA